MGINYSTDNYTLIVDLLDPFNPIYNSLEILEQSIFENIIIPKPRVKDRRFLVFKHNHKQIYVLYEGDICPILICCDVNENLLLNSSKQFNSLTELRNYINLLPNNSNLLEEINKIDDIEYNEKINDMELGGYFKPIIMEYTYIDFSDSESNESDELELELKLKHNDIHLNVDDTPLYPEQNVEDIDIQVNADDTLLYPEQNVEDIDIQVNVDDTLLYPEQNVEDIDIQVNVDDSNTLKNVALIPIPSLYRTQDIIIDTLNTNRNVSKVKTKVDKTFGKKIKNVEYNIKFNYIKNIK